MCKALFGVAEYSEMAFTIPTGIDSHGAFFYNRTNEKIQTRGTKDIVERFTSHTLNEILPYLPDENCFFDTRNRICALLDDVLPFSVMTRISSNAQQFLKVKDKSKVKLVGNVNPSDNGMNGNVFDGDGLCPTLTTNKGEGPKITEPIIAASRGRDKVDNSSENQSNYKTQQKLELNKEGISNTLTGVQKDNLLVEPSLHVPQATAKGYIECPPGGVFDASYPDSKLRRGRVQNGEKLLPTLTCGAENGLRYYEKYDPQNTPAFRIRKLTPRECFRLMGVTDSNVDTIQEAGISNCQQYKMAGNSIVVDVLEHIFRKLFVDKENEDQQLSLF